MVLKTNFMGLELINPVIVAGGPWSGNSAGIQNSINQGAGAVVTETISLEPYKRISPRAYYEDGTMLSTNCYGQLTLEEWENEIERIKKKDTKLICSIHGNTPSETAYIAKRMERMGADGLQLDLFSPIGPSISNINSDLNTIWAFINIVANSVTIPVMTRLPHYLCENGRYIETVIDAGTNAIATAESIRAVPGVDIETFKAKMPTYSGYTGPNVKPISLAAISILSQIVDCDLSGVGGIVDYQSILEFIMLGAKTAQLGSVIMLNGYNVISEAVRGLTEWGSKHRYKSIDEVRGIALPSLGTYEDLSTEPRQAWLRGVCCDNDCMLCVKSCLNLSISKFGDGSIQINDNCNGCGICVSRCPKHLICI